MASRSKAVCAILSSRMFRRRTSSWPLRVMLVSAFLLLNDLRKAFRPICSGLRTSLWQAAWRFPMSSIRASTCIWPMATPIGPVARGSLFPPGWAGTWSVHNPKRPILSKPVWRASCSTTGWISQYRRFTRRWKIIWAGSRASSITALNWTGPAVSMERRSPLENRPTAASISTIMAMPRSRAWKLPSMVASTIIGTWALAHPMFVRVSKMLAYLAMTTQVRASPIRTAPPL